MKPKIIAFYLPQYHPTTNNDKWWGKGFTEWTNVCKARPLFRGHYQPHVPADLGFYDLRMPEAREAQADLAKNFGIYGFCYYHYWFDDNKLELEKPMEDVLKLGKPDFPFMACWANESWHAKFWGIDGVSSKITLSEQKYGENAEIVSHFNYMLPFFKDNRYIKKNNKPVFMIYRALEIDYIVKFMQIWKKLAQENGFDGVFFIGQTTINTDRESKQIIDLGYDAASTVRYNDFLEERSIIHKTLYNIYRRFSRTPLNYDYNKIYKKLTSEKDSADKIIPTIIPNWDHTPRSGRMGNLLTNSTPQNFRKHLAYLKSILEKKNEKEPFVFLKSWNEWGEGNHVEPDLKYGLGYLEAIKDFVDE